ncbi:hypothetical protein C7212DRAFT_189582 [Tuber magnatum]|uniref:Extracellular membrane protein CFEM domain-containing protein n=1 Tax=Tuber magnatum TaxID=42249 RepID=A0A317SPE3_9PEZI|nr:hypothetical protein C7212DRAFT_189582 [Tuber magnatum]
MKETQFGFAAGILCLISLISSSTSGVGVVLQPRDVEVDFSGMPECASKTCIPILGSSLGCGPRISVDCFCGKPNPLLCGWYTNWDCWNRTEGWYDTQCPGRPLVDFTGIPSCVRSCFDKLNVCVKSTSNCVCSQPRPDCSASTTTCNSSDIAVYDAWYSKSCEYNQTTTSSLVPPTAEPQLPTSTTPTPLPTSSSGGRRGGGGGGLSKGGVAGAAVGAFAGTVALGALLYFFVFRRQKGSKQDRDTAQPAPAEMEDSSHPKVRYELMSGDMNSAPPIEAPGDNTRPTNNIYAPVGGTRPTSELSGPVSSVGEGGFNRGFYEQR